MKLIKGIKEEIRRQVRAKLAEKIKERIKLNLLFNDKGWKIYQVNNGCKHGGFMLINDNGGVDFKDGTIYDLVTYCNITYTELGKLKYDNKLFIKQ